MIPLRVYLKGFLTYQHGQTFDFTNATLWMLHGRNGVGKSAVFDAMGWALYGEHRNGKQGAANLINHNSDRLTVEYEFQIEDDVYRIRRSIPRRGLPIRQIDRETTNGWKTEPRTDTEEGFDDWIQTHIGLSYRAFTATVMLRQGKSEELLNAKPAERFDILEQLLDLSLYRRLFEKAQDKAKDCEATLNNYKHQLTMINLVNEEDIEQAGNRYGQLTTQHTELQSQRTELMQRLEQTKNWEYYQSQIQLREQKLMHLDKLVSNRSEIEQNYERFRDLNQIMPLLRKIARRHDELAQGLGQVGESLDFLVDFRDLAHKLLEPSNIAKQVRLLQPKNDSTNAYISTVLNLVLDEVSSAQNASSELETVLHILPHLETFMDEREQYRKSVDFRAEIASQLQHSELEIARITQEKLVAENAHASSQDELTKSKRQLTIAQTLLGEVVQRLQNFETAILQPTCEWCGQPISSEHIDSESKRLEHLQQDRGLVVTDLEALVNKEEQQVAVCKKAESLATKTFQRTTNEHASLTEKLSGAVRNLEKYQTTLKRLTNNLPAEFIEQIVNGQEEPIDWSLTIYPSGQDLASLRQVGQQVERYISYLDGLRNLSHSCEEYVKLHAEWLADLDILPTVWQDQAHLIDRNRFQVYQQEQKLLATAAQEYDEMYKLLGEQNSLQSEISQFDVLISELPPEARQPSHELEAIQTQLNEDLESVDQQRQEAYIDLELKKRNLENRESIEQSRREMERQLTLYKRLKVLLDRKKDGLQLFLLREAEQNIIQIANGILTNISGGTLTLARKNEKEEAESKGAFDLVVYDGRLGSKTPIGVNFTSGSQRFRVAVSLALAIGQYIGRSSKRIESVIIDEGFGGLDTEGRDAMIDALNELQLQLKRIIVVSHQDDFANVFVNKYLIQLNDGVAEVSLDS